MNPEKLAKLTPHGVDPGKAPGRGTPEITAQDIAAAMGMARLSELEYQILLVKYAGHGRFMILFATIWDWVLHQNSWKEPKKRNLQMCAEITMAATSRFMGKDRCEVCEGTGEDWSVAPPITCKACHGHGTVPDTGRFEGVWQSRYRMLIAMLEDAEERALRRVKA